MSVIEHNLLFNFAASYSHGGYKRLFEYARWFDAKGGSNFVIHKECAHLREQFPANRYYVVAQSKANRFLDDCSYLHGIADEIGQPDLYYSYGIPLYFQFGRVNWFHLSNVLALTTNGAPLSLQDRFKFAYLGWLVKRGLPNAEVVSAESMTSLDLLDVADRERLFLSVNGSDDELKFLHRCSSYPLDDVAVVVGTYRYKGLTDAVRVFEMLRETRTDLKLLVFGREEFVPAQVKAASGVVMAGNVSRGALIDALRRAKYYLSTTYVENSYNAAAEGIFCAAESYISDIGPHRELLQSMPCEHVSIPGLKRKLFHVKRDNLNGTNLKTWDAVIGEMMTRFETALARCPLARCQTPS